MKQNEKVYLDLLEKILNEGEHREDRTNTGTISLFGCRMEFDISESIPVCTTKKVLYDKVLGELLWILSGSTKVGDLHKYGINFWDLFCTREFLDNRNLQHYEPGDLGPIYGFQWRHWGAKYVNCRTDYTGQGIDQIATIVRQIKEEPWSRRIVLSAWNVSDLDSMTLPPCHMLAQFNVREGKYLDCMLTQRSGDMFLGIPFNIASYSTLTYMLAFITNLKPGKFIHSIGDAHIYSNHIEAVNKQLNRQFSVLPTLTFNRSAEEIGSIDGFTIDDFKLENYHPQSMIKAPMAV